MGIWIPKTNKSKIFNTKIGINLEYSSCKSPWKKIFYQISENDALNNLSRLKFLRKATY